MKRTVVSALAAMMLMATPVMAADVDLSGMTLDELVELRTSITEEIETRTADEAQETIGAGYYIAGKDIKVGKYELSNEYTFFVAVFRDKETYEEWDKVSDNAEGLLLKRGLAGETCYVALEDGNVLVLNSECSIKKADASWAPEE